MAKTLANEVSTTDKVGRPAFSRKRYDSIKNGKDFALKMLGFENHDYEFLGKVSGLLEKLDVGSFTPVVDEHHINVTLRNKVYNSALRTLLNEYGISADYPMSEDDDTALLHNGGSYSIWLGPIDFDR